jgi:23S rRNA pseudouridine955/2504/2580 synthase
MNSIEQKKVSYVIVDESSEGQRLDNFLLKCLRKAPKSLIYRIIRKGEVRVNKGRAKPDTRLTVGDSVRVPPVSFNQACKPSASQNTLERIRACIIYEDETILVVNKPAGLPVHGGSGLNGGLIELMRLARPELRFLELVHRLDKATSGCLLLAKKRSILRELNELLQQSSFKKYYLALTKGHWAPDELMVDVPLEKFHRVSGERVVKVGPEGKKAKTQFKVLERFEEASLVEARLYTGRTHQIRVHAQCQKHPIASDEKYGDKVFNQYCRKLGLKRMFLHAARLEFYLPSLEKRISIEAPLDESLQLMLKTLEKKR